MVSVRYRSLLIIPTFSMNGSIPTRISSVYSKLFPVNDLDTAWKVSKYGVISGPYSVRIQENTDQK